MLRRKLTVVFLLYAFLIPSLAFGQMNGVSAPKDVIDKIKDEGMNRSQVMQTLSYLSDVIGARLTGSPGLKNANEWTKDTMTKWGLKNAHLEAWGPFGRGWTLKSFNAEINSPYTIPLIAYPKAWSPSTNGTVTADVVYLDVKTDADFDKYKGQLKGKIVLISDIRETKADFTGMGSRYSDEDLTKMEAATPAGGGGQGRPPVTDEQRQRQQQQAVAGKRFNFMIDEGVAVVIDNSRAGSGGTLFVQGATVAQPVPANPQDRPTRIAPQQKESDGKILPQVTVATEH